MVGGHRGGELASWLGWVLGVWGVWGWGMDGWMDGLCVLCACLWVARGTAAGGYRVGLRLPLERKQQQEHSSTVCSPPLLPHFSRNCCPQKECGLHSGNISQSSGDEQQQVGACLCPLSARCLPGATLQA